MTYRPTTAAELKAALEDPAGPHTIDCDVLRKINGNGTVTIDPVVIARTDIELIGRGLNLWTNSLAAPAALSYDGPTGAADCDIHVRELKWRTNAERGARIRNATGWTAEGVEFMGADIGWAFGAINGGQCEQLRLDDCGGTQIKFHSLLFEAGCSYNGARIDQFRWHHHNNPDGGETAYAMTVLGNLYQSNVDLLGWQDDQEDDATLLAGNKGVKVHRGGSVSRSTINLDAENGGSYLMKIEMPEITMPWEGPDARRLMVMDWDSITLSGTWPYAYGLIVDLMPDEGDFDYWVDVDTVNVSGGHLRSHGKGHNEIVGLKESNRTQIIYPAGVSAPA